MENDVMYNIMCMLRGRYKGEEPDLRYLVYDDIIAINNLMNERFDDISWDCGYSGSILEDGVYFLAWLDKDMCLKTKTFEWRN